MPACCGSGSTAGPGLRRRGSPIERTSYNALMIACLFDIDGTLLASGGAGKAALESAFTGEFGIELRGHIPYAGRTDRAIVRDLFRMHDVTDTPENLQKLLTGYLRRLPDTLRTHNGRI